MACLNKGPWGSQGRVQAEEEWGTKGTYLYFGSEVESFGVLGIRLDWPIQKWGFSDLCGRSYLQHTQGEGSGKGRDCLSLGSLGNFYQEVVFTYDSVLLSRACIQEGG